MRFNRESLLFLPGLCLKTAGRFERRHVYIYLSIVLKVLAAITILGWLVATLAQPKEEVWSAGPSAWLRGTPLPRPKGTSASLTFVADDHLYSIGGAWGPDRFNPRQVVYREAFRARLGPGGMPGEWIAAPGADLQLAYAGLATNGAKFFVTGGFDGQAVQQTTYCSLTGGDGLKWLRAQGGRFSDPRFWHASVVINDILYVIGGGWEDSRGAFKFHDSLRFARLAPDHPCQLGDWQSRSMSPIGSLAGHAVIAFEGRAYVIGGFGRDYRPVGNVFIGKVGPGGDLTNWHLASVAPPLPPVAHHAAILVETERKIYVFGGLNEDLEPTGAVYSAVIKPDGELEGWRQEMELRFPDNLFRHSVTLYYGSAYLVGGQPTPDTFTNQTYYIPAFSFSKVSDPAGPVHEGEVITYSLSYANTGFTTQTMTISDVLPFNLDLIPGSAMPPPAIQVNSAPETLVWELGQVPPGASGQISFQARVALLGKVTQSISSEATLSASCIPGEPAYVLPAPVACETTRFWAAGTTFQGAATPPYLLIQIPPGAHPSAMWLLMKGDNNQPPIVEAQPAELVAVSQNHFGASIWEATVTPDVASGGQVRVSTQNPRALNAILLFNKDDPPFAPTALDDFYNTRKTFTYLLDIPSVATQTMDVIFPLLDVTYWTDDLRPDTRLITVTAQFGKQSHRTVANGPNLGNGLLMMQFPFDIGPLTDTIVSEKELVVTVDTKDSVYTLGPRACRPVYIENVAWLCSKQMGCVSDRARNVPEGLQIPGGGGDVFLPLILKRRR